MAYPGELIISRVRRGLLEVKDAVDWVTEETLRENSAYIIDLNQKQLYDHGKDRNDTPLNPPYAEATVVIKRKKGQPTNRVTLKDTGYFYEQFDVQVNGGDYAVGSYAEYTRYLTAKYGNNIFGLNVENTEEFKQHIRPIIIERLKEIYRQNVE